MIRGFLKNLTGRLRDPSRSYKERVFIALTLISCFTGALALIGDVLAGEHLVEIVALVVTILTVPVITTVCVMRNRVATAARIIVLGLAFLLLPILFFFGGGLEGGGSLWIIFTYLYIGLSLSGAWRVVMIILITLETGAFYLDSYLHPEHVTAHSRELFYIDSLISMIIVGAVCFLVVRFEEWMFDAESRRAREETQKVAELNRSQNRFFSSMSHEIRTPINSILGLNEIILRQEDASDEILKDAGNIQGAGKMLLSLINDIMDLSKIEAGKMEIVPVNYNVASLVSEIVNMMWLRAEQKGLQFNLEVDPTIPVELFGDEVRIKQILVNLLNNAVKYTKEGSVTLHIEKEEIREGRVLMMFTVSDTGIGIKQDALPHLFDAFRRVDQEKNRMIEGTGLGLSIVRQLVELMDGRIMVNSVYTQGSVFTVTLWQKISRPDAVGSISISSSGSGGAGKYTAGFTAADARILIVDDNEMNLEVEKKLLAGTQITVDTASSGEEALQRTMNIRYDMILMDHLMPEMDGIECLQNIRRQTGGLNNHVPVIVLTANAGSENRELYTRSGFDNYLVKPVSGQQLEEMILLHLPEDRVIRAKGTELSVSRMDAGRGYSGKIPVLVAASTMIDLPAPLLREYQIDTLPFSVHTENGIFYDGLEVGTKELMRYFGEGMIFSSEAPSVEEFDAFFARELKKAHHVLYITISFGISHEYERATEAARAYGSVSVFNSTSNSSATGMLVLLAHKMSTQGRSADAIMEELDRLKNRLQCSYVTEDLRILIRRGYLGKGMGRFMTTMGIRPVVRVKNDRLRVERLYFGDHRKWYERYIDHALPRNIQPDPDVIFVTHVGLPEEDLQWIGEQIRRHFAFKRIIFQEASSVMSLNCGFGAFGLLYMTAGEIPCHLGELFELPEEHEEIPEEKEISEEKEKTSASQTGSDIVFFEPAEEKPVQDSHWYDGLTGFDVESAIKNCGDDEIYHSALEIFFETIDEKIDELETYYREMDLKNYTIKVHALKSSARLVGATELGDDAYRLEMAGKEEDTACIRANHAALIGKIRECKAALAGLFGQQNTQEDGHEE